MRCAIVDDEMPAVDELSYLISKYPGLEVVATYNDGLSFVGSMGQNEYDAVFLDIDMPQVSGILVADYILKNNIPTRIVFVTAYEAYAIKAFEFNAVDYLLKPVSEKRFENTVRRLIASECDEMTESAATSTDHVKDAVQSIKKHLKVMSFYSNGVLKPVKYSEIACIFFEDRTTHFITVKGKYTCKKTLSEIEDILYSNFFRCHRAYIINLDYVDTIEPWFNNTYMVKLRGFDLQIPVSRSNVNQFKEKMHIL
ncbi:LytR/AlgR family response regulator transcription factor [Fusibacter ferrireducens]|uniref:Stage 0 sporulation protein A homolog n=1 Tax=Fusibacter ferrireducens TaxID=2785058 RepID=A0ABR9ZWG0_9FIRM|nr:LytTR family DNA-binding domain-containing protein [Fusibacter ferrireducens]MBF4694473.1 response regulator transcription factor [Fusibacter ferrireducens]